MLEPQPYVRAAFDKEEKLYLLKAGLLILAIYFFRTAVYELTFFFVLLLPFFLFSYIWFKSIQTGDRVFDILKEYITFIPITHAEGAKKGFIPKAAIVLVVINVLTFYLIESLAPSAIEFIIKNFIFLPFRITWWNLPLSPFTSMFLHADAGHLWGNMAFFWAFGPAVEERLGAKRFILLYLGTGLAGDVTGMLVKILFFKELSYSLGASGAISGIMGVFMVRCYFKKLVIPVPLFGLVNAKIKVNSLLPLGYFFLLDLSGGFRQLAGSASNIGYWAHIGSMVAGMLISARLKLHREAAEEKYTEAGLAAVESPSYRYDGVNALQAALQLNPENEAALLGLAREYALSRKPEGRDLFQRAIRLKLRSSPAQAAGIYKEYMAVYNRMLDPDLQYRLAAVFYQLGDFEPSARALEMIILEPSAPGDTRQSAFFQLIVLLAENNMLEAAHYRLRQFAEQFPKSELVKAAEDKFVEVLKK